MRHDIPAAFALAAAAGTPIVVGHSLGGQLALLATAAGIIEPQAVVTIAAGTSSVPASAPARARARRALEAATVRSVSAILGYWPGHRLGFGGIQPRPLMRDWAHEARFGRYRLHGDPTDYEGLLTSIRAPILLTTIEGDSLITPASAAGLRNRLPDSADYLHIHAGAPDHFRWARRDPALVIDAVEQHLL